jgi:D-tagatose-1,6-bisphosphate aldolase subunit GatZ/KbaZ
MRFMNYPKYYIGPMSKNIVESIVEFNKPDTFAMIPSRRQVDYNGGYVNNWTTKQLKKCAGNIIVQRDHAGPDQGYRNDDGYRSLKEDCKYFDLIHIDPWKRYHSYEDGLEWTVNMIKYCYNINPGVEFEVGTEQSIRYFKTNTVESLLYDLQHKLTIDEFDAIRFVVIQSGTSLEGNNNTGHYNGVRLQRMVDVVKSYGKLSKEHNGDYLPVNLIKEKFNLGLDAINIAPEFGYLETLTYLDNIPDYQTLDTFWKICYDSDRWRKWVDKDFDPKENKQELIKICGHYVLSDNRFISLVKNKCIDIDKKVKHNIYNKLRQLYESSKTI